jgi:hypothetical protein
MVVPLFSRVFVIIDTTVELLKEGGSHMLTIYQQIVKHLQSQPIPVPFTPTAPFPSVLEVREGMNRRNGIDGGGGFRVSGLL